MLASGRPVIATSLEGSQVSRVLQGIGKSVPPGDTMALVQAILELAGDPDLMRSFGQASREWVINNLDKGKVMSGFLNILKDISLNRERV